MVEPAILLQNDSSTSSSWFWCSTIIIAIVLGVCLLPLLFKSHILLRLLPKRTKNRLEVMAAGEFRVGDIFGFSLLLIFISANRTMRWLFEKDEPAALCKPIFFCGVPRSGTTMMHRRILHATGDDRSRPGSAVSLKTIDLLLPSRILRLLWMPAATLFAALINTPNHVVHPFKPEEDCLSLLHHQTNLLSLLFFSKKMNGAYARAISHEERWTWSTKEFEWYAQLLQNVAAGGKRFIGKPMCSTPQIFRWLEKWPDCKLVVSCRHPWPVLRSLNGLFGSLDFYSSADLEWDCLSTQLLRHYRTVVHFVQHPHPRVRVVRFSELMADPDKVICSLIDWCELAQLNEGDVSSREETHKHQNVDSEVATKMLRLDAAAWKPLCKALGYDIEEFCRVASEQ